jgi:hypothetical protein
VLTLARFTQWPASAFSSPSDPLQLCLLHRSPQIAEAFAELEAQTVAGRAVRVKGNPDKVASNCHVVFIHESAELAGLGLGSAYGATPILTVGDSAGFSSRNGMVELVNVDDATRLDVNLKALHAAQLGLSSQVLKLARQIRE